MLSREEYMGGVLRNPASLDFDEIKFIYSAQVFTSANTRLRCQYACSLAHQSTLNPPLSCDAVETRSVLDEYRYGLMLRREASIHQNDFRDEWRAFARRVLEFERGCFVRGYSRAFAIAIGSCLFGHHDDELRPCEYPEKSRPTFEAVGIDLAGALEMINWEQQIIREPGDPFPLFALVMVE